MPPQTDVIVNSTSRKNWKTGPISEAILRKAGYRMEDQLQREEYRMERELQTASSSDTQVIVTDAFDLQCKQVYHILWPVSAGDDHHHHHLHHHAEVKLPLEF